MYPIEPKASHNRKTVVKSTDSLESFLLFEDNSFPKQRVEKTSTITDRVLAFCDLGLETCNKILHSLVSRGGLNHLRL